MTTQYIIKNSGGTFYYKDTEMTILHREDGPASEYADGNKSWWLHGVRHREEGPAVVRINGTKSWWLHGKEVSEEEHKRLTTKEPTITIEGKAFTVAQLKELISKASI
jgi:hypothetical protein